MSNARAMELDATRLGDALMTAYMISVQLGHKHVANTLRDYYHPGPAEQEQAFLVDLFTWGSYLGDLERVMSVLLFQERPTAWRRRPSQGDGGLDVGEPNPGGLPRLPDQGLCRVDGPRSAKAGPPVLQRILDGRGWLRAGLGRRGWR